MKKILLSLSVFMAAAAIAFVVACKKPAEPESGAPAAAAMDADAQKGKELYTAQGCAGCHGETGKGDGPAGQALNPRPRNYRNLGEYKQGTSQEAIASTLLKGVPNSSMVAYPQISEADRMLIAKYVVYLQTQP